MAWTEPAVADASVAEGVTLFTIEIHPTKQGYDFTELKHMIAWRDRWHAETFKSQRCRRSSVKWVWVAA